MRPVMDFNRWKPLLVPAAIVFLSCVTLVLLGLIMIKTQFFSLEKVSITGLDVLQESDVRTLAEPYLGKSIFSDEIKMLERRLEDMTWVQDAVIRRKLPDSISISVVEREPVALLVTRDDPVFRTFSVDATGYLIAEGNRLLKTDLPVITGLEIQKLYAGEQVRFKELDKLLVLLEQIRSERADIYDAIKEINMANSYGLIRYSLVMSDENIPVVTQQVDEELFDRVMKLLSLKDASGIRRISAYSNMLFVEEKGGSQDV